MGEENAPIFSRVLLWVIKHMYPCKISIWPNEMYFVVVGTYSWF